MKEENDPAHASFWPGSGILLLAASLVVAGYGAALLRGPAPAAEVRIVVQAAPSPAPAVEDGP